MEKLYKELLSFLKEEDKENALRVSMEALEEKRLGVIDLYEKVLAPALNSIIDEYDEDEDLIWREHVRSAIIRTIIENTYSYVIEEKEKMAYPDKGNVIVMCPRFEDHELGARMATDFFTIAGYKASFIGSNTPESTILKAIEDIKPKYISISVTNYYNLVAAKKTIDLIKESFNEDIKFLIGGYAVTSQKGYYKDIGGDLLVNSFQDILDLDKGVDSR